MKENGYFRRLVKGAACVLQTEQFCSAGNLPELKTIVNGKSSVVSKRAEHLSVRVDSVTKNNPWA
jgi:hypothetical protein